MQLDSEDNSHASGITPSGAPLGQPIPPLPHAVSVSMPLWNDVVGYEAGDARVHSALTCGYPRFVLHPFIRALFSVARNRFAVPGESVYVFPSLRSAQRAVEYLAKNPELPSRICSLERDDLHAVVTSSAGGELLREFWQHSGEVVSSRRAQALLHSEREPAAGVLAKARLRARLAHWYACSPADVFLFASGMAAIYQAFRLATARRPGCKTVQLGYPYVDTIRVQERIGRGAHFIAVGAGDETAQLRDILAREEIAAVFTEVPANPLLRTAKLDEVSRLLRAAGVPLIVDDTLGSPLNVDVSPYADITASSLTKFASGKGNVMAGSLILGKSALAEELRLPLHSEYEDLLWGEDALVLEANSRGFAERVARSSEAAHEAALMLREHSLVEEIFYPAFQTRGAYDALRRSEGGYGAVLSVLLKEPERRAPLFYNALGCAKGPGLGNEFTLACPYTILTHFQDLSWAEDREVSRWLVRISIGAEDPGRICETLIRALQSAR
jgi:cystathionine gamma-synthase